MRSPPRAPGDVDSARELRDKKRVLAALVVHDLRSPLAGIQGYLDLLREELGDIGGGPPRAQEYVDEATALVGRALGLVATILDVDELEEGLLRVAPVPVHMAELIERARASNRANYEIRQLRFDAACDPDLVVELDPDLFWRVFENLLDNAARFAPRGGRCALTVRREAGRAEGRGEGRGEGRAEGWIEIAVGNDGPPVPPAEREAIFGRYFQVEARRAAARANRGLGLYFCKLAVEAHGGSIHVEERGDLGCVFVIRIPQPPRP